MHLGSCAFIPIGERHHTTWGAPKASVLEGKWSNFREILVKYCNLARILLMVQKSSFHQLRLVVYPIIYRVSRVVGLGISEPSTVV